MWTRMLLEFLAAICFFVAFIPGSLCLECYNCKGVTYFDPDHCFNPSTEDTIRQECRSKTDQCEKKVVQVDGWTESIERGCSANCDGRNFIWTEDFKVHCCNKENLCNEALKVTPYSVVYSLTFGLVVWVGARQLCRT